ncbi:hypothetical protein CVS30_16670 [Arthrobacter psychrolactophilus]|uniref:FAD:protein FMN transferase n=1 Tax=Arthrobacter psychrolactophilus TaxID=92442 RepID=A0A2V5IKN9_9MICC|nr:FAD:protein FMN transferase [Arthrobacter psychrolactophilus]PYI37175.1 hypothetical protein CVS30_16670 [Arthrobacter psychrolactophilus]
MSRRTLVEAALDAARLSRGAVDPSLGSDLTVLGYDRDFTEVLLASSSGPITAKVRRRTLAWQDVHLEGDWLRVPAPLHLDLGATAKAVAANLAARRIVEELGSGVMVSLGGDIATAATAGTAPHGGWQVLVQDRDENPGQQISLVAGKALATSSTQKRR